MTTRPTELRLTIPSAHMAIFVNDRLVGQLTIDQWQDRDTLLEQVHRADALRNVPRLVGYMAERMRKIDRIADHINTTAAAKQQAFARGLMAGLERKTVEHPIAGTPAMPPEHTHAYRAGYEWGDALARCTAAIDDLTAKIEGKAA